MAGQKPDVELDWVKVREDLDNDFMGETIFEKAKRKTRENPLVPLGKVTSNGAKISSIRLIPSRFIIGNVKGHSI